jgi:hypothetical protein
VQLAEPETVDQRVGIGRIDKIGRWRRQREVIAELPRLCGQRQRDRAGAENEQRRMRRAVAS